MNSKRFLSVILAFAMIISTMSFPVLASEGVVAENGENTYATLAQAVNEAQKGDTITVIDNISDETVTVDKSITITGAKTAENVSITVNGTDVELTVSGLSFTGNSWINSGNAKALTVSSVTAEVTPDNKSATNSRSAFIALGSSEQNTLELTVKDSSFIVSGGGDPILGWAAITKATISGNTFGSESSYIENVDAVKFMSIAEGAAITVTGNTVYSNYNGFVFGQNTTRDNAYTVDVKDNDFYGSADHIWVEVSGAQTTHATVLATSDNTVNGNTFAASDIKTNVATWTSYAGVDVVTDSNGKVISGTLSSFSNADALAEGYEKDENGTVIIKLSADLRYAGYVGTSGELGTDSYREYIQVDLYNVNALKSLVVELWSGEIKLSTTTMRDTDRDDETKKLYPARGTITANIVVNGRLSGSWDTEWHVSPGAAFMPDNIKVYADHTLVDTIDKGFTNEEEASEFSAFEGVANGSTEKPYLIGSVEELKAFRDSVNAGNNYNGQLIQLTADIDLSGIEWTSIGTSSNPFKGTFDGGNYTISNLICLLDVESTQRAGLFGQANNAIIKNVKVHNVNLSALARVSPIVAGAKNTTVENCHVTGNIKLVGYQYVGAIVGYGYVTVKDCSVTGNDNQYGVYTVPEGDSYGKMYMGGIVGWMGEGNSSITNCSAKNLSLTTNGNVGAITGIAHYGNTVKDCTAENITITANSAQQRPGSVGVLAGGTSGTAANPTTIVDNTVINVVVTDGGKPVTVMHGTDPMGNGTHAVTYVATIGDDYYTSLQDAFDVATSGDTIKLIDDVIVTDTIKVTNANAFSGVTLDGNGLKIIAGKLNQDTTSILYFGDNTTNKYFNEITIEDLTIEADTARFALMFFGGSVNKLNNVKISGDYVYAINFYGTSGATMTDCNINTSVFTNGQDDNPLHLVNTHIDSLYVNKSDSPEDKIKVYIDDTSSVDELIVFRSESTYMVNKLNNVKTVKTSDGNAFVAQIGNVQYASFKAAIDAAADGETLKLINDAINTEHVNIDKDITIDLNGKTLKLGTAVMSRAAGTQLSETAAVSVNGDVKFVNGTIDFTNATTGWHAVVGVSDGTLTLGKDVKITGTNTPDKYLFALYRSNSKLVFDGVSADLKNVNGKYFIKGETGSSANPVYNTVEIKNSDINIENGVGAFNILDLTIDNSTINLAGMKEHIFRKVKANINDSTVKAEVTVSGEYFIKNDAGENITFSGRSVVDENAISKILLENGSTITTAGFRFNFDITGYTIPEGYKAITETKDGNTYWYVVPVYTVTAVANTESAVADQEITVDVTVTGGAFTNADWKLVYDPTKVEYLGTNANNYTISGSVQGSGSSNEYKDGEIVASYKFKVLELDENADAVFTVTDAHVNNYAMAGDLNNVAAEMAGDTVKIVLNSDIKPGTIKDLTVDYKGMDIRANEFELNAEFADSVVSYTTNFQDALNGVGTVVPPSFKNVGTYSYFVIVEAEGYATYVTVAKVTIEPLEITPTGKFNVDPDVNKVEFTPVLEGILDNTFTGSVTVKNGTQTIKTLTAADFTYDGNGQAVYNGTPINVTGVTSGTLTLTVEYTEGTGDNYATSTSTATTDVDKVTATDAVIAALENAVTSTFTYDGKAHEVEISTLPNGWSVKEASSETVTNVGDDKLVKVVFEDTTDKCNDVEVYVILKINPKQVTIKADSTEKKLGEADKFTYTVTPELVDSKDLGEIKVIRKETGETAGTYVITVNYTPNKNYDVTVVDGRLTIGAPEFKIEVVDNTDGADSKADYTVGSRMILVYTDGDYAYFTCDGKNMYDVTDAGYMYVDHDYEAGTHPESTHAYKHVYAMVVKAEYAYEASEALEQLYANKISFAGSEKDFAPIKVNYNANINENSAVVEELDVNDYSMTNGIYNALYDTVLYQVNILKADYNHSKKVDTNDADDVKLIVLNK